MGAIRTISVNIARRREGSGSRKRSPMPGNGFNPKDRNVQSILGVSDARLLGIIGAASWKSPPLSARFGDEIPAAGHAGVTRGQLETKESDMKRYATLLIATLAVLGLADAARADWG